MTKTIDPRTTRRRIMVQEWNKNRALFFHWEEVGTEPDFTGTRVGYVVIQRTPAWCEQQAKRLRVETK